MDRLHEAIELLERATGKKVKLVESNTSEIKPLFDQNLGLTKIGTYEQYQQYLGTIFPDSRIRDFVYRGDRIKFLLPRDAQAGVYFTSDRTVAERYGQNLTTAIISVKNPLNVTDIPDYYWERVVDRTDRLSKHDSVVFNDGEEIVVSPEQVHVLGSEKDIEGFARWMSK